MDPVLHLGALTDEEPARVKELAPTPGVRIRDPDGREEIDPEQLGELPGRR